MKEESKKLGYIRPDEADICKNRGCLFLREVNGIYICQPGVLADNIRPIPIKKVEYMKMYLGQLPSMGCTRNFHLEYKKWRKY